MAQTETVSANAKKRAASNVSGTRRVARTRRHTLASASSLDADVASLEGDKKAKAAKVGELIAARAKAAGIDAVVFDHGGSGYHGRIAALADAAREGGLEF